MKKTLALLLPLTLLISAASCSNSSKSSESSEISSNTEITSDSEIKDHGPKYHKYSAMTPEEIVGELTLEQKAAQMVQPAIYNVTEDDMRKYDYGSILSTAGCVDTSTWRATVDGYQNSAIVSDAGIPYIYGQDDVHGVNYCRNAVYFPHNIGQGAANDEELAYQVGLITADEAKLCHMIWNFSPVVAQSVDPRWGRTYESYGSDLETITKLSTAYTKGLLDGGLIACTKHFFADGNVVYGTGEQGAIKMLIDRGDAQLSDEEIAEQLKVYQAQIDAGVQTIMISHSSLNGVKMHENKEYIMKLKDEMGFEGFIVSDWGSVGNITGSTYKEKVIKSVNAGIDMLMETDKFEEAKQIIIEAVENGEISEERVNDAVTRIIKVKKEAGIFDDPLFENLETKQEESGSLEYRKVAEKLVEESLVLLKNENDVLPLKEGTKVYITGPAADNGQAQCGGWTMDWNGANLKDLPGVTTIKEAFERYAEDYKIEVITDAEKANEADVVLLCVGEQAYSEWNGDTEDMELCGTLGLEDNAKAIKEAKELGKPTVACIVAGRQVILDENDYSDWDSVVMCYLPGSEGKGISDVLCGCAEFSGKLPSPWYNSIEQIRTDKCWLERGYGLTYGEDFKPETEPETVLDTPSEDNSNDSAAEGTKYEKGLFKDGVYVNDYANIVMHVPGNVKYMSVDEVKQAKQETIDYFTDEKVVSFEKNSIWDSWITNNKECIYIKFVNTKLLYPDSENVSAEQLLNDYKEYYEKLLGELGGKPEWQERTTVKLGSEEYLRDVLSVKWEDGHPESEFDYVRKIDDDLICFITFNTSDPEKTLEYYEELFN
ncbi:MAG: glycoside hydrolase family 3 protein [Ruminococcus sp.]|nr:glycoside hydrolase family 3 protein [Ruminococcus sp.]